MVDSGGFSSNTRFCRLCDAFLVGKDRDCVTTVSVLDGLAKDLALDKNLRVQMGTENPSIWPSLNRVWDELSRQVTLDEGDPLTPCLATSFAKFTRNLVAAVPSNQQNTFASEPALRRILYRYTSWAATQDPQSYVVTRMLVQTLSNMVTSNDDLISRLWEVYMNLPEDQVVFIRLLGSPDASTIVSLLVLLINCTHESNRRQELLAGTHVGARLCIALLDRMAALYDADESSDGGKAFDYMFHLFAHLFDGGFAPKLYASLSVCVLLILSSALIQTLLPGETVTPHQTTLLKLLDSYLQSSFAPAALVEICPLLTMCFFEVCTFSVQAMQGTTGTSDIPDIGVNLSRHDAFHFLLPKACEALVLVIQCLISIMLEFEGNRMEDRSKDELCWLIRGAVSSNGQGIAVCAIELLRALDAFLPRIHFGRPAQSSKGSHSLPGATDPTGFSYLKRDLVRLLGVLCCKNKKIQDSIRTCEGITVVMNMCVVDERNPYLREHAIFTLHNLLEDNEENQNVVNSIQLSEKLEIA